MADERPNPDLLLAEVQKREAMRHRGKLKIFFGMAAGVGKTYAMLEEARKRAAEGLNVLVGYAEPHIRPETESLLLGLEILPYKMVEYRNAVLKEFDLDAALARKPSLVLVDELAHTNAPGMRHAKRWQDVDELLDAGINVYATLNVQHLESVNDIVERISGVRVRETLPDSVLERADEVELVDIAPEELLERFREGRIYRPEQAERAARHFFTKGNLIALRELALRTTAQRVDDQMLDFRRDSAVKATWPASERVLVCVSPSPLSARLVRSAKRLAGSLKANWVAAFVETPRTSRLPNADRQRVEQTLRLAEQLGGQAVTLNGENIAAEIIAYAQTHNITKVVIGKPLRSRWRDFLFGSAVDDLIRASGQIDVYVIRGDSDERIEQPPEPRGPGRRDWIGAAWAVGVVVAATAIGWPLYHWFDLENTNVLMLYLLGVLWVATHHSRGAAILASVLGVAAFDWAFVPPYYFFTVNDQQYIVTFIVMLLTALVISALTLRVRAQADAARHREHRTAALFALSRELAASRTLDEVIATSLRHLSEALGGRAVLLLPDGGKGLIARGGGADMPAIDSKEAGVAQWVYEHSQAAGRGTNTLPAAAGTYVPLNASGGIVGVLGFVNGDSGANWTVDQRQLMEALASQTAQAVERAMFAEQARQAWERVEAEFLRNTLLSGVSHELRTPLAAITGAAGALTQPGNPLTPDDRAEMIETIHSEAERMERLIDNLLEMTRLESGGLVIRKEWVPFSEIVGSALRHLDRRLKGRDVRTDLRADLPLAHVDSVAMEQVLVNLLDNAIEYTPPASGLEIMVRAGERELTVDVADRGPGLPEGTEKRVFEKFFRIRPAETRRGIGLGLAICRGIVEAHGGTISAANRAGGGAVFRFSLPFDGQPPAVDASA